MTDRLLALRRAVETTAATHRARLLVAYQCRAAHRAGGRQLDGPFAAVAAFRDHPDDFRDHVAGTAYADGVADAHVLARDLVHVVQRGVGDRHPADEHRFEARDRCQHAGAPDLEVDVEQPGQLLLRRELVRDGPARCARHLAELRLPVAPVDLVDHAVDVEIEGIATLKHRRMVGEATVAAADDLDLATARQAPVAQPLQHLGVAPGEFGVDTANAVGTEVEWPLRGDHWIELAQAAGRRVARVDERLLAARLGLAVVLDEPGAGHEDLATHLQQRRHVTAQA